MERDKNELGSGGTGWAAIGGWEVWEAAPRDGPAIFAVDAVAHDAGRIVGRWIKPGDGPAAVEAQLTELLGRIPETGNWAIIDQVGLPLMVPETLDDADLPAAAQEAAEAGR